MNPPILKWAQRVLIFAVLFLILLGLGGATYQWIATRVTERRHPPPGTLINVGNHQLNIHIRGNGGPTVVIDAGLSGASYDWEAVADGLASFTRVCTYDRAGYGWSDSGPLPQSSQQAVLDLHTLLQKAPISPPFILLAHSWAGINARLYASKYPQDVAGLVLVESLNYDLDPDTDQGGQVTKLFKFRNWTACMGSTRLTVPKFVRDPENDPAARKFRWAMLSRTKSAHAIYAELTGQSNWLSVRSAIKSLGNKPVLIISRRIEDPDSASEAGEPNRLWLRQQQALLGISTNSKRIVAKTKSHNIQFYEPGLIVDAVHEMITASQTGSNSPAQR